MAEDFRRFSGTRSYLTNESLEAAVNCALALERPLLVKGELTGWQGHSAEQLRAMKDGVERARQQGVEPIDD